jgi:hypothetical protein
MSLNYAGELAAPQSWLSRGEGRLARAQHLCSDRGEAKRGWSTRAMAFDDLEAELALLINQMDTPPEDPHELFMRIAEKLNEFKALGLPLPDDLVRVEKELGAYFKEQQQAAKKR